MTSSPAAKRRVDPIGIVMALVFAVLASMGLTGQPWWVLDSAAEWLVAGGLALIGAGLLASSIPGVRRAVHRAAATRKR